MNRRSPYNVNLATLAAIVVGPGGALGVPPFRDVSDGTSHFITLGGITPGGMLPASGYIRSAPPSGAGAIVWWNGRNTNGDAPVVSQTLTTLTIGDTNWNSTVLAGGGSGVVVRAFAGGAVVLEPTAQAVALVLRDRAANFVSFLFAMPTDATGEGSLQIINTIQPATPANGPKLFAVGGAAKCIGTSGTVTTFGPAEPHCPSCGKDFSTEHDNKGMGYLAVCLSCLAEWVEGIAGPVPWIRRERPGTCPP